MKKIIVIFFLVLLSTAEWQQREEFTLPKGILVNDIKIGADGKIWILTRSSLSQFDYNTKNLMLLAETQNAKLFAVGSDEEFYLIDNNRLLELNTEGEKIVPTINFTNPTQIEVIEIDKKNILAISDGDRIVFTYNGDILGTLNTNVEKFSFLFRAGEQKTDIAIYTMTGNQIYSWTGGNLNNPTTYKSRLMYSAAEPIIDFATGQDGRNYILFKDSILILNPDGESEDKILVQNVAWGSRIFIYPKDNLLILFERDDKVIKILSPQAKTKNEIITLNKNRPNPVENYTEFEFTLNEPLAVTLTIYNLIGKPVKVVANGYYQRGTHIIPWHADDEKGFPVPNGVYFYRLDTKRGVLIKQLIVLR